MKIVVVTAHPDDYIYGTAGTLMVHRDDERHVAILAPLQQASAEEVGARLGVELHVFDGRYKAIERTAAKLSRALTELFEALVPDYVLAPHTLGDWSPDHTAAGRIAFNSYLEGGSAGQWNARFLRYPIPATTTRFEANVWIDLPKDLIALKLDLAATMTRGADDIWPRDVVEWEIGSQLRFAHQIGWPSEHAEGFDAVYAVPFSRLPPRDDRTAHLVEEHRRKMLALRAGQDLSNGRRSSGAQP